MKKAAKISMGIAGAAAAACIVAGVASGNGFKDLNMVSAGGILAEAQTVEGSAVDAQSVGVSDTGITAGAETVQEGAMPHPLILL